MYDEHFMHMEFIKAYNQTKKESIDYLRNKDGGENPRHNTYTDYS